MPDSDAPIIKATGVHKTYQTDSTSVHALQGVDLRVARGEMISIMGPSGCGKTTLLNCLSGLDGIDDGLIQIEGQEIQEMPDSLRTDYRARRMGFIFQFYNLLPVLSAAENIELPLLVSGTRPSEARARAEAALEQVGLLDWASHRPAELSGGQRQRVTIARALVNDPAIVWADEPTGDLDSANSGEIMTLIEDLNARKAQTFVIVTHDQGVGELCHRTVLMRDGQIEGEVRHREFESTAVASS